MPAVDERMTPDATIVIVTKDRREEALRAVASAVAQTASVKVLVLDDGSSDGTTDAIREAYPEAVVERFEEPAEITARRNLAGELARAPILVVIDDVVAFSTPDVVEQTLREFDHPRVGAVAIPYVDVPRGDRLLSASYVVRLGRADPITHFGSPQRNPERVWFLGTRNDVVFTWYYVPGRYLLPRFAKVSVHLLWLGFGVRRPGLFLRAILAGYRTAFAERHRREPVPPALYRVFRRLGYAPERLEAVERVLPEQPAPRRTPDRVGA